MHLGVYVGRFFAEQGGGYSFVADLLAGLAETGTLGRHRVTVLCEADDARGLPARVAGRWPLVALPAVSGWRLNWLGARYYSPLLRRLGGRSPSALEQAVGRLSIDLLWFPGVGAVEAPDAPYIATVWDLEHRGQPFFPEVSHRGEWDKREQFYSLFLRRAACILTGTAAGRDEIVRYYQVNPQRVRIAPLPTPRDALAAATGVDASRWPAPTSRPFLLYPAQFWPHKNHVNLVDAFERLIRGRMADLDLVLVGGDKGNLAHVRASVEARGLAERVHFLGFVPRERLLALYTQATALVFVALFGPDNLPPLEAFALGCPVVAARLSGSEEQFGDAALLVDGTRPEDIAAAVGNLLGDAALRGRLVAAGRARAEAWTSTHYLQCVGESADEFAALRRNWSGSEAPDGGRMD